MYQLELEERARPTHDSLLVKYIAWLWIYATAANLTGLLGGLLAIFCLLFLHGPWNIRIPLYLIVVFWTLVRPRVALYLLPIAIPWGSLDQINLGGLNLTSADILVGLLALSWLMSYTLRPFLTRTGLAEHALDDEPTGIPRYLLVAILVFLLAILVSMTGAFSVKSSLKEVAKWLEFGIVVLLGARYLRTRQHIWTLVIIMFLAAISQAFYGYIQDFFNIGPQAFIRDASLRVYGTFDQPNPYAGYINMTLAVALTLTLLGTTARTRILAGITTLLLVSAELLSQSRGGEIALATVLIFVVTIGIPYLRKLIAVGAVGSLLVVAGYLAGVVPSRLLNPILRILGLVQISFVAPSSQDYSTAERLAHWIAGINMFVTHPFTGVGIGNYPDAYAQFHITIFVNSLGHAHNFYINMAAETGIIGLLAFLLFLIAIFVAGARAFRTINARYRQHKQQRTHPLAGMTTRAITHSQQLMIQLTNDRALALGLLAALLSVCVHNMVDNLYVHSMANLFALLLIALIRLEGVTRNTGSNGGHFDY